MESPPNHTKPIGRGMMVVAWIMALGVLAWIFGDWEENQYNPNREMQTSNSEGYIEVTLDSNHMHHYVANGTINGTGAVFLLDTGATDVVVSEELARNSGLAYGPKGYAQTANGTVEIHSTVIEEVRLGPIVLRDIRASINPAMFGEEVLFGMSALRHLELVQRDNQLTLRQSK